MRIGWSFNTHSTAGCAGSNTRAGRLAGPHWTVCIACMNEVADTEVRVRDKQQQGELLFSLLKCSTQRRAEQHPEQQGGAQVAVGDGEEAEVGVPPLRPRLLRSARHGNTQRGRAGKRE